MRATVVPKRHSLPLLLPLFLLVLLAGNAKNVAEAFSAQTTTATTTTRRGLPPRNTNDHKNNHHHRFSNRLPCGSASSSSSSARTAWRPGIFGKPAAASRPPEVGTDGLYHIATKEEYSLLLEDNPGKLVVLKVFAPWCKTCKALEPRFRAIAHGLGCDRNHRNATTATAALPIVWVDLAHTRDNRDFVRDELGVRTLPTVQFYAGDGERVDSFPCGPPRVETVLKPRLARFLRENVDPATGTVVPPGKAKPANASGSTTVATPPPPATPTTTMPAAPAATTKTRHHLFPRHPLRMLVLLCRLVRSRLQKMMATTGKNNNNNNSSRSNIPEQTTTDSPNHDAAAAAA